MAKVITYQSPSGHSKIDLCPRHVEKIKQADNWPRTDSGQEICQVYKGLHYGWCDACTEDRKNNPA